VSGFGRLYIEVTWFLMNCVQILDFCLIIRSVITSFKTQKRLFIQHTPLYTFNS